MGPPSPRGGNIGGTASAAFRLETPAGAIAGWSLGAPDAGPAPVLYIHPINLQGACWKEVAALVSPRRFALMPDLRGHGSSAATGEFSIEAWSADCVATLDFWDVEHVHVVGGSLGGSLAVALAASYPDRILSITAIGSALKIAGDTPESVLGVLREKGVREMFREVLPRISVAPGTSPELLEQIIALTNPNDAETVAEIWRATITADVHDAAPAVTCPALVLTGEFDLTCTPAQGAAMAEALGVPLTLIPDVGHLPMFEAPEATARLLSDHMERAETPV